tara:strand:+ start:276 stop:413 length:138 start_codon:yes stop_codon:yes gene_type:complete
MRKILNDFLSMMWGEKEYSNTEIAATFGFLIFIALMLGLASAMPL